MALFSKPPGKKPSSSSPKVAAGHGRREPVSARELAAKAPKDAGRPKLEPVHADDSTSGPSLIEWTPQTQAFEVAQANPGLCAVLENAALLYASGQASAARTLLEQGVESDHDTRQSPLAWLALFDLLQRAGDRPAFDQLAVRYSLQFERSAPAWEGRETTQAGSPRPIAGGYIAITHKLTAESAPQIEGLRRAIERGLPNPRLDLASVASFDDEGARLLAGALAEARKARLPLSIERPQKLAAALNAAVNSGREGGEGAWLLSLELLQWAHEQGQFDDRAIEFAIAFEVSPPSWEPPPLTLAPEGARGGEEEVPEATANGEAVTLSGVLAGNAEKYVTKVVDFAHGRQVVPVDVAAVERIDFVCAGGLLNAVTRIEGQRKAVQILGATPIIRSLLLLIGLSPRHFVKKAASF